MPRYGILRPKSQQALKEALNKRQAIADTYTETFDRKLVHAVQVHLIDTATHVIAFHIWECQHLLALTTHLTTQPMDLPGLDLPAELWTNIFDLAADEDVIFQYALPNVMAESAWFRTVFGEWTLRSPQEALNLIQRRSYATKKAITATCKSWRRLGSEFLFRCLFFDDPAKLRSLCAILDRESSLGWWTKRIHITRYYAGRGATMDDLENALVSVIRHCPNLEIFVVDWPMGNTFGPVADALSTYCPKSLRTVHWNIPSEAIAKAIWALDSLPFILAAHIEFDPPVTETLHLGSASDLHLTLPRLQQLSLRGCFQEFLEQATGWSIPALKSFSFDCGPSRIDQPDAVAFLTSHGASLIFLDLFCIPPLDIPKILELCPRLTTFTFNPDWRLTTAALENNTDTFDTTPSILVNHPHDHITHIGCHGLLYAFGVGFAATYASEEPIRSHLIRRANDRNFAALNRTNFPALKCVRALSRTVLCDLNMADGPDATCFERWERWWSQCARQRIRLEDCTGNLLGTLPEYPDEENLDDDDEEEVEEGEDEDEEVVFDDNFEIEEDPDGMGFRLKIPPRVEEGPVSELRQLLNECRKMSAEREESQFVLPGWQHQQA